MIGQMRSKVTVTRWNNSQDAAGGNIATEALTWDLFCQVKDRRGVPTFSNAQPSVKYDYEIIGRYYPSRPITTADTFTFDGKSLDIKSIVQMQEDKLTYLKFLCDVIGDVTQGGTSGGSGGGGTPDPTGANYLMVSAGNQPITIYHNADVTIDWGGGDIEFIGAGTFKTKTFTTATVYHQNRSTVISMSLNDVSFAVTGSWPTGLVELYAGIKVVPIPTLPATLTLISLTTSGFDSTGLDSIISDVNGFNTNGRKLDLRFQITGDSPTGAATSDITALQSRGWEVLFG